VVLWGVTLGWFLPHLAAQVLAANEPVVVSAEHPRLFLRPSRLRLLRRERERSSQRWQQFETLMKGNAPMPERGFAEALEFAAAQDRDAGHKAVAWVLGPAADLRQMALVYDWCRDLMTDAQRQDLAARMGKSMAETAGDDSVSAVRSRVLAAVTLFDEVPQAPQRELERVVRDWWGRKMVPALLAGRRVVARDDAYALYELLHAMRDGTNFDLRESCPRFFKDFPIEHLLSHYPAPLQTSENDFHIGAGRQSGEPDLRLAALSRAAELAMVAYDVNAPDSQVLQGWLMHDHYMLRGTFGAPYEFLWADPYQPGLSYYLVPLIYYNSDFGTLFVRSSWEDTADWFGYFDGVMQLFQHDRLTAVNPQLAQPPLALRSALVCLGQSARKFRMKVEDEDAVFIVGLEPRRTYQVEIDDEEMYEVAADRGGILELDMPRGKDVGVRLK